MDYSYLLTPFISWLMAGTLKFTINSIKFKTLAFKMIGYGGLPSNHSAIVSSMVALIAFKEGIEHPSFGVSLTLAFIVILDANSLRQQIGKHAAAINKLTAASEKNDFLRERMGHTRLEIGVGILVGIAAAVIVNNLLT
jgi:acid phosphatase family membrane protein YuiD